MKDLITKRNTPLTKAAGKAESRNRLSLISNIANRLAATGCDPITLAALLALAARGLLPGRLQNSDASNLVETFAGRFFDIDQIEIDSSEFADRLTVCIGASNPADGEHLQNLPQLLADLLGDADVQTEIKDPLFVGWVYQALLMARENYSSLRNAKSPDGLSQITQWFTPYWIADFLGRECFSNIENSSSGSGSIEAVTFLDSSCGAGHILAPALHRLVNRRSSQEELSSAVAEVLRSELFGIDLDPLMIRLSAFSIYLTCRDLLPQAPLPIPQLFAFDSDCAHGSLVLSLHPRPEYVTLRRIDGAVVSLKDFPATFDAQALNPPYLSHRLMPEQSAKFLREHYEGCHYDLYTAFLELGIRLMAPGGRMALICQQSFLTTARFEMLRRRLIERCRIESIVQLGPGAFASRAGEKVNNAIVTLSAPSAGSKQHQRNIYAYNLMSPSQKQLAEKHGIESCEKECLTEEAFLSTTCTIPGFPFAPFCPEEISDLYKQMPTIAESDSGITLTNGLFTCDNNRFVRQVSDVENADHTDFVPYDKGGGQKWYCMTPYVLEWKNNGDDIREFRAQRGQSRALPGERFYFKEGVTYSYIGTRGFKARLLSPGSVFDIASSAMFSERIDLNYLLGFLNSSLVRFILGTLNPTVNFQIGDLRRVPLRVPPLKLEQRVASLAIEAVDLAKDAEKLNPVSPLYCKPVLKRFSTEPTQNTYETLLQHVETLNLKEAKIQKAIDEIIFNLYEISSTTCDIIQKNEWVASTERFVNAPSLSRCMAELNSSK